MIWNVLASHFMHQLSYYISFYNPSFQNCTVNTLEIKEACVGLGILSLIKIPMILDKLCE